MHLLFKFLKILNKNLIALSVFITQIIISDLSISIISTVLKSVFLKSVNSLFQKIDMPKQAMGT